MIPAAKLRAPHVEEDEPVSLLASGHGSVASLFSSIPMTSTSGSPTSISTIRAGSVSTTLLLESTRPETLAGRSPQSVDGPPSDPKCRFCTPPAARHCLRCLQRCTGSQPDSDGHLGVDTADSRDASCSASIGHALRSAGCRASTLFWSGLAVCDNFLYRDRACHRRDATHPRALPPRLRPARPSSPPAHHRRSCRRRERGRRSCRDRGTPARRTAPRACARCTCGVGRGHGRGERWLKSSQETLAALLRAGWLVAAPWRNAAPCHRRRARTRVIPLRSAPRGTRGTGRPGTRPRARAGARCDSRWVSQRSTPAWARRRPRRPSVPRAGRGAGRRAPRPGTRHVRSGGRPARLGSARRLQNGCVTREANRSAGASAASARRAPHVGHPLPAPPACPRLRLSELSGPQVAVTSERA